MTMSSPTMNRALIASAAVLGMLIPVVTYSQPLAEAPLADPEAGVACPLDRVAMVRGSDAEAREGGGFEAARGKGIHGAVDLNGSVGEPVFAVAQGKVVVAARGEWGKLGKTVVVDHLDGGHTIYGHLHSVDVTLNTMVTAGQFIGTMGYSGNARSLRAKHLPPHLHFAYVRGLAPLGRVRDAGDVSLASHSGLVGVTGVVHPIWAVRFLKCWEEPLPVGPPSLPSRLIMR